MSDTDFPTKRDIVAAEVAVFRDIISLAECEHDDPWDELLYELGLLGVEAAEASPSAAFIYAELAKMLAAYLGRHPSAERFYQLYMRLDYDLREMGFYSCIYEGAKFQDHFVNYDALSMGTGFDNVYLDESDVSRLANAYVHCVALQKKIAPCCPSIE